MGVSCDVTNILRENILKKMPPSGSGLLPGDNYPDWLTFNSNGSCVTFEVPVDRRSLKTIMCIAYSSSQDNTTTEGIKVVLVIDCAKNTIQVYKIGALLASFDEEEWQRVLSNIEPGNEIKVVVVFKNEFIVKKTTIYFIYVEPIDMKNHWYEPDENKVLQLSSETSKDIPAITFSTRDCVETSPKQISTQQAANVLPCHNLILEEDNQLKDKEKDISDCN